MSEDELNEARRLIAEGSSIRKAALQIGFHESTLRDRLKKGGGDRLGRFRPTFTPDQEKELVNHCVALDRRFFGLTLKSLRFLLFKYAEENNISHRFCVQSQLAGRDFTREFMKRNKLSLRVPRKTSVARAMGFNRAQLNQYFDNLGSALKKYHFTPERIYNIDETGVQTVPNKLPLHVAPRGKREVAKTVAAEQGQTVTAVCAMNALGHYIPPYFIYPRKRENRQLIRGGPIGCDMAVTDRGYMNTPTFIKWLEHFIKHTNPTPENPVLLILDNHVSHKSLEAVTLAKSKHVHLLTLPPHSSHKTQPLDRCFFGPLKGFYDAAVDAWDVSNPGQTFDIYSVAATFKVAFEKAGTIATAAQGFKSTGIVPLNPEIFTEADFLPSEVTDQEPPEDEYDEDDRVIVFDETGGLEDAEPVRLGELSSDLGMPTSSTPLVITTEADNSSKKTPTKDDNVPKPYEIISPEDIIPLPKISIKRKRCGKGLKSQLLTATPIKEQMEKDAMEKEKLASEKQKRAKERKQQAIEKKRCKLHFPTSLAKKGKKKVGVSADYSSESESESDFSVHDSSSDLDIDLIFGEEKFEETEEATSSKKIQIPLTPNDFAVVKVQGKTKSSFRLYVAKIISMYQDGYEGLFYKKIQGAYKFIETQEESFIPSDDIIMKLSKPICIKSSRFNNAIAFSEDLSEYTLY